MLLLGLGLLVGCATNTPVVELPAPAWPGPGAPVPPGNSGGGIPGVMARSRWSGGAPVPSLMNRMLPVKYITVHHDGMNTFTRTDERSVAARIESIRRGHRGRGWGDIGYHYIIDPAGRVWEGRALSYQGAHVKDRNENNLGVVCLGNFDEQIPTPSQVNALSRHVSLLMQQYRVLSRNVFTHQEWPGAVTACPGRSLEAFMKRARSTGQIG